MKSIEFGGIKVVDKSGDINFANETIDEVKRKREGINKLNEKIENLRNEIEELQEQRNNSKNKEEKEDLYGREQEKKEEIKSLKKEIRDLLDFGKVEERENLTVEKEVKPKEVPEVKDEIAEQALEAESFDEFVAILKESGRDDVDGLIDRIEAWETRMIKNNLSFIRNNDIIKDCFLEGKIDEWAERAIEEKKNKPAEEPEEPTITLVDSLIGEKLEEEITEEELKNLIGNLKGIALIYETLESGNYKSEREKTIIRKIKNHVEAAVGSSGGVGNLQNIIDNSDMRDDEKEYAKKAIREYGTKPEIKETSAPVETLEDEKGREEMEQKLATANKLITLYKERGRLININLKEIKESRVSEDKRVAEYQKVGEWLDQTNKEIKNLYGELGDVEKLKGILVIEDEYNKIKQMGADIKAGKMDWMEDIENQIIEAQGKAEALKGITDKKIEEEKPTVPEEEISSEDQARMGVPNFNDKQDSFKEKDLVKKPIKETPEPEPKVEKEKTPENLREAIEKIEETVNTLDVLIGEKGAELTAKIKEGKGLSEEEIAKAEAEIKGLKRLRTFWSLNEMSTKATEALRLGSSEKAREKIDNIVKVHGTEIKNYEITLDASLKKVEKSSEENLKSKSPEVQATTEKFVEASSKGIKAKIGKLFDRFKPEGKALKKIKGAKNAEELAKITEDLRGYRLEKETKDILSYINKHLLNPMTEEEWKDKIDFNFARKELDRRQNITDSWRGVIEELIGHAESISDQIMYDEMERKGLTNGSQESVDVMGIDKWINESGLEEEVKNINLESLDEVIGSLKEGLKERSEKMSEKIRDIFDKIINLEGIKYGLNWYIYALGAGVESQDSEVKKEFESFLGDDRKIIKNLDEGSGFKNFMTRLIDEIEKLGEEKFGEMGNEREKSGKKESIKDALKEFNKVDKSILGSVIDELIKENHKSELLTQFADELGNAGVGRVLENIDKEITVEELAAVLEISEADEGSGVKDEEGNGKKQTARDVENIFDTSGKGMIGSFTEKVGEYDERIRAVVKGEPLKEGDTAEQLKRDFKQFAKQDWSEDFSFHDFEEEVKKRDQKNDGKKKEYISREDEWKKEIIENILESLGKDGWIKIQNELGTIARSPGLLKMELMNFFDSQYMTKRNEKLLKKLEKEIKEMRIKMSNEEQRILWNITLKDILDAVLKKTRPFE